MQGPFQNQATREAIGTVAGCTPEMFGRLDEAGNLIITDRLKT